jgi:hypothetical protein
MFDPEVMVSALANEAGKIAATHVSTTTSSALRSFFV